MAAAKDIDITYSGAILVLDKNLVKIACKYCDYNLITIK